MISPEKNIISSISWSMAARAFAMTLRFITILLLPIYLSVYDMGLLALVSVFVNLPVAFADLGFGTALIKFQNTSDKDYNTIYTLNILTALIIALTIILLAPTISKLTNLHELQPLLYISSFAIPLSTLAIVPNAILQKQLKFKTLALRDGIGELAYTIPILILAALDFKAYAAAYAIVTNRLARLAIATLSLKWKPKIQFSINTIKNLIAFSSLQIISLTAKQLFLNLDKLLLATFLSPAALGLYNFSLQFSVTPINSLTGAATNVFFSTFAKLNNNKFLCKTIFSTLFAVIILLPLSAASIIVHWLNYIPIVYNETWKDSVAIAQMLLSLSPIICAETFEAILIATGKEKTRVLSTSLKLILMIILIILTQQHLTPLLTATYYILASLLAVSINTATIMKNYQIPLNLLTNKIKKLYIPILTITTSLLIPQLLPPSIPLYLTISMTNFIILALALKKEVYSLKNFKA